MSQVQETKQNETYGVVADFDSPEELLHAIEAVRKQGYSKLDAMTPFPIHGIDEAMGAKRSILGYIVIWFGLLGAIAALLLQWWTGAVDYPLVIGGKPLFAFEFSIPITFELTVLFSAFAAVIGMFALNGLPRFYHPTMNYSKFSGATNDRFLLVIEKDDPKFDAEQTASLLRSLGSRDVEIVEA
ncbi:MAG: DUF3341 domain-containing protein [Bryobacteraceae bacterium]